MAPTCAQAVQRALSQQSGDKVLGVGRQRILSLGPDDVIWGREEEEEEEEEERRSDVTLSLSLSHWKL